MKKIAIADLKSPSPNILIQETANGYVLCINRSNYGLTAFALALLLVGIAFLIAAINNSFMLLLACATFYSTYWVYSFTIGFLEIRFYNQFMTFIWDDEIRKGLKGRTIDLSDVKKVSLQVRHSTIRKGWNSNPRYNAFITVELNNNETEAFSCVDPEYHPFVSIFIKKYIRAFFDQIQT